MTWFIWPAIQRRPLQLNKVPWNDSRPLTRAYKSVVVLFIYFLYGTTAVGEERNCVVFGQKTKLIRHLDVKEEEDDDAASSTLSRAVTFQCVFSLSHSSARFYHLLFFFFCRQPTSFFSGPPCPHQLFLLMEVGSVINEPMTDNVKRIERKRREIFTKEFVLWIVEFTTKNKKTWWRGRESGVDQSRPRGGSSSFGGLRFNWPDWVLILLARRRRRQRQSSLFFFQKTKKRSGFFFFMELTRAAAALLLWHQIDQDTCSIFVWLVSCDLFLWHVVRLMEPSTCHCPVVVANPARFIKTGQSKYLGLKISVDKTDELEGRCDGLERHPRVMMVFDTIADAFWPS